MSDIFNNFVCSLSGKIDNTRIDRSKYDYSIFVISEKDKRWVRCKTLSEYDEAKKDIQDDAPRIRHKGWQCTKNYSAVHSYNNLGRGGNKTFYSVEKYIDGKKLILFYGLNFEIAKKISDNFNRECEKHGVPRVADFIKELLNEYREKLPRHLFRKETNKILCSDYWEVEKCSSYEAPITRIAHDYKMTKVRSWYNTPRYNSGTRTKEYRVEKVMGKRRLILYTGKNLETAEIIAKNFNMAIRDHGISKSIDFAEKLMNDIRMVYPERTYTKELHKVLSIAPWPINS